MANNKIDGSKKGLAGKTGSSQAVKGGHYMQEGIRTGTERLEALTLSANAVKSVDSRGREYAEPPCELRTVFQRDRDRIIHCKAFRRLKHKTQVFLAPESDHYRTRLTHTLEVAQIARTIARALRLNEDLTEAIALGHDLGHTPFGHAGERALNQLVPGGFRHYEQSVRVCRFLEKDGQGLNLTYEVLNGIERHTCGPLPETLEGQIVRISDRIAYINHDIDDAVRAGVISEEEIEPSIRDFMGHSKSERINTLVKSVVFNSVDKISVDSETEKQFDLLHDFLFERVYTNPIAKGEESKVGGIIEGIYDYLLRHESELPQEYRDIAKNDSTARAAADYIAGMTDHYAIAVYSKFYIPKSWAGVV